MEPKENLERGRNRCMGDPTSEQMKNKFKCFVDCVPKAEANLSGRVGDF